MRVFVAGATGVLGRRIVEGGAGRGHKMVGLVRDEAGEALVRERGGEPVRGDLFAPGTLIDGAQGADVVVHAATAIPTDPSPDAEAWERNDRVRREGTTNLVDAAAAVGADRYLQQSIVWIARQPDGAAFDERVTAHPDPSTRSALDAEHIALAAGARHDFTTTVLRGGYFYAADTAHTRLTGERLLARRLPIIGGGLLGRRDATLSFLHVDDAARAYLAAIEGEGGGVFHVVDDEPISHAAFLATFAAELGAPSPRRIPAWLARLMVDDNLVRLVTRPMPTSNDLFVETFDWGPEYPTVDDGLEQVIERWRDVGAIRATAEGEEWVGFESTNG